MKLGKFDNELKQSTNELENKIDQVNATIRVIQSDISAQAKFIAKKNDDSSKMQEIISAFKDRIMEKYVVMADEYTTQFRTLQQYNYNF